MGHLGGTRELRALGKLSLNIIRAGIATGRLAGSFGRAFPILAKAVPAIGAAVVTKEVAEQVAPITFDVVEATAQVAEVLKKVHRTKLSKVHIACKVLEEAFEREGRPIASQALGFVASAIVIAGCETADAARGTGHKLGKLLGKRR